ncbi:MAG TPA: hypothetical protein VG759_17870, partial [Candidatus Angelobacter sp.]|nr:hypothetical protein [Candidatus Angelobacter sp.]
MHRFRLHKLFIILAVVSVIVALTVGGCRWRRPHEVGNSYNHDVYLPSQPGLSKIKTLRVVLRGPFVVLVRSELHNRITVYIPQDAEGIHQFRYPNAETPQTRYESYHFELPEQGLEINRDRPYVDHGFDDFNEVLT